MGSNFIIAYIIVTVTNKLSQTAVISRKATVALVARLMFSANKAAIVAWVQTPLLFTLIYSHYNQQSS